MGKIYLTSDTHFGHDREFIWKARGFNSVEQMNEIIIDNWNGIVEPEDTVYHLGDVMLGDKEKGMECLLALNGNITIIAGNHDTNSRIQMYKDAGFRVEQALRLDYQGYHFFLSHYPAITANFDRESLKQCTCNLYGHTHQLTNFYQDMPFMYHVGMDSHSCQPVLLDDIISEMNNKIYECKNFL